MQTGPNKITDIPNREPEKPVGLIFKNRLREAKDNLERKIKKMTVSGSDLKRKSESKKAPSPRKRRKVNDIFTQK